MISRQLKVVSAGVGACAVVAMGAIGLAFSDISAADTPEPAPPGPVTTSGDHHRSDDHRLRGRERTEDVDRRSGDHDNTIRESAHCGTALDPLSKTPKSEMGLQR